MSAELLFPKVNFLVSVTGFLMIEQLSDFPLLHSLKYIIFLIFSL